MSTAIPSRAIDIAIYVHGLSSSLVDQSVDTVTREIAHAMERNAAPGAQFLIDQGKDEDYEPGCKTRVLRILRKDAAGDQPVLDVYEMSYANELLGTWANESSIRQIFRLALVLLSNIPRFIASIARPSKTARQKVQVAYATGILLVLVLYATLLLLTATYTVFQQPELGLETPSWLETLVNNGSEAPSAPSDSAPASVQSPHTPDEARVSHLNIFQYLVIIFAGLGLFTTQDYQRKLRDVAVKYMATINYFNLGERKNRLAGQLASLLDHILSKDTKQRRVYLMAYSFGSIVAIDSFYTSSVSPHFKHVKALVTIGCPFDFIRMYWPSYFEQRPSLSWKFPNWVNIYNPLDVLGSNFRDKDDRADQATAGIQTENGEVMKPVNFRFPRGGSLQNLGFWDILYLTGFKAHSLYWEGGVERAVSCFDIVVSQLYSGDPLLE